MKDVLIYDTTLRDGCQAEDISFTLEDKLRIAEKLDELGVDYIEGGYPGSNPRDADFFKQVKKLKLKNAKIASFGTTRKPGAKPSQDLNLKILLDAGTPVVTLVGKTWDLHVRDDLRISKKANVELIADSLAYMKRRVDEVIFDAEHFFDGFARDAEYAVEPGSRLVMYTDVVSSRLDVDAVPPAAEPEDAGRRDEQHRPHHQGSAVERAHEGQDVVQPRNERRGHVDQHRVPQARGQGHGWDGAPERETRDPGERRHHAAHAGDEPAEEDAPGAVARVHGLQAPQPAVPQDQNHQEQMDEGSKRIDDQLARHQWRQFVCDIHRALLGRSATKGDRSKGWNPYYAGLF